MLNRFHLAHARIKCHKYYSDSTSGTAPYGYYRGRRIISETGKIDGGVFIGVTPQEALVIDSKYRTLNVFTRRFIEELKEEKNERKIVILLQEYCYTVLPGEEEELSETEFHKSFQEDRKIALDQYLNKGFGAQRHRVLLAGFLLEKLKKNKMLAGNHFLKSRFLRAEGDNIGLEYVTERGEIISVF